MRDKMFASIYSHYYQPNYYLQMKFIYLLLASIFTLNFSADLFSQNLIYDLSPPELLSYNGTTRWADFKVNLPQQLAEKGGVANCHLFIDTTLAPEESGTLFSFFSGSQAQDVYFTVKSVNRRCYFTRYAVLTKDTVYHFSPTERICFDIINSIEDNSNENIVVLYPNPATDFITIKAKQNKSIEILNSLGAKLEVIELQEGMNTVSVSSLATGLYFLKSDNKIITRFIRQ